MHKDYILFQAVVTYSSTYVLVALSIDRFDAITRPMNFSGSCKSRHFYKIKYQKHSFYLNGEILIPLKHSTPENCTTIENSSSRRRTVKIFAMKGDPFNEEKHSQHIQKSKKKIYDSKK